MHYHWDVLATADGLAVVSCCRSMETFNWQAFWMCAWLLSRTTHTSTYSQHQTMLVQVDEQSQQRLQGLTELYNVADDPKTQHMLLRQAITYAIKANLANLLGPVIKVQTQSSTCFQGLPSTYVNLGLNLYPTDLTSCKPSFLGCAYLVAFSQPTDAVDIPWHVCTVI